MRRGVGIAAIKKREDKKAFEEVGKKLQGDQIVHITQTVQQFQTALQDFAAKHRDQINMDPIFRRQFHVMCSKIGVDPLASKKGFWSGVLGVGDFYYELAIQCIHICAQTRQSNGGIISIPDLTIRLQAHRKRVGQDISHDDVRRAISSLKVLGNGLRLHKINHKTYVISVPSELSPDHDTVIDTAGRHGGSVSLSICISELRWSQERFDQVMSFFLSEGIVWIDQRPLIQECSYYFYSIWKQALIGDYEDTESNIFENDLNDDLNDRSSSKTE